MLKFYALIGITCLGLTSHIAIRRPMSLLYGRVHTLQYMEEQTLAANEKRAKMAAAYSQRMETLERSGKDVHADLVVVIVSVARQRGSNKSSYLLQTASSMHRALTHDTYFSNKTMFVCNVEKRPMDNFEAVLLEQQMFYVNKATLENNMGLQSLKIPELYHSGLTDEARKQEIVDYVFCLNASLALKPKYVLVLEDDVLPMHNMFQTLYLTLKNKLQTTGHVGTENGRDYSFLKLYYPQYWQGFELEAVSLLELFAISVVGAGFGTMLTKCWGFVYIFSGYKGSSGRRRKFLEQTEVKGQYYFVFCFYALVTLCCVKIIGRVNFMEFRRWSPQLFSFRQSPACCTPAVLYTADVLPKLMNHLLVNNGLNKDLAIHNFSVTQGPLGYQIEPNLFRHIGMMTSLSSEPKPPEEFLFETHETLFAYD